MKTKPVHSIRFGAIEAAIWKNQNETSTWFNVTITRSYKEGEGFKETTSFGRDDLPLVSKVSSLAHTWIFQQKKS
jgi:hypothetical protein